MLAGLDIVVFLKSHDGLERTAERVFGALKSQFQSSTSAEYGDHYVATGLGFTAVLFSNSGDVLYPAFEEYSYGLELLSDFWCVDLEGVDIEGPMSEYYARQLAFDLNVETATEILLETSEDAEIFEYRSYRRNPQYRLDQAPTTPRVFVIESRQIEEQFDEEDAEDDAIGEGQSIEEESI
jgi:hypothetical protein